MAWWRGGGPGPPTLVCLLILLVAAPLPSSAARAAPPPSSASASAPLRRPPSILFILADDAGVGDFGAYRPGDASWGPHGPISTPTLDQFAKEGMRFSDAYAGAPVCAPSRCALLTGRHSGHCTVRGNQDIETLQPGDATVASVLQEAGYRTGLVGKWGLGDVHSPGGPNLKERVGSHAGKLGSQGFDFFYGYASQIEAHDYYPKALWRNDRLESIPANANASDAECLQRGARVGGKGRCAWAQDLIVKEAIQFLRETAGGGGAGGEGLLRMTGDGRGGRGGGGGEGLVDDGGGGGRTPEPFFLFLSFNTPHAGGVGTVAETGVPVPSEVPYRARKEWPQVEREYAAAVTAQDAHVGHVLRELDRLGLANDTVVFFSSDNGAHAEGGHDYRFFGSSGPHRGFKRSLHEGRVPAGEVSGQQWAFYDFLQTVAEIAEVPGESLPPGLDGYSALETLLGGTQPQRGFIYTEYCQPNEAPGGGFGPEKYFGQAVRVGDWKAVCVGPTPNETVGVGTCGGGEPWVYNLSKDPHEDLDVGWRVPEVKRAALGIMRREHTPFHYADYCRGLEGKAS